MAKRGLKLSVPIPNFMSDGPAWRRALHAAIVKVQDRGNVQYSDSDKLEVEICFHLKNPKLTVLDLDNRLKDVFDALQGFVGEKGKIVVAMPCPRHMTTKSCGPMAGGGGQRQ